MLTNRSLTPRRLNGFQSPLRELSQWTSNLDPFSRLRDDVMDMFNNFSMDLTPTTGQFMPRIEVDEQDACYVISAEVPGMAEEDLNVQIQDNCVILEGEKREENKEDRPGRYRSEFSYGSFHRSIPLGDEVDAQNVKATYANGILSVTVNKLPEARRKSKKIPIISEESKQ